MLDAKLTSYLEKKCLGHLLGQIHGDLARLCCLIRKFEQPIIAFRANGCRVLRTIKAFAGAKMAKPQNEIDGEIILILSAVAEYFGLSMAELREGTKSRAVVLPRQIGMYLAKQLTRASLQEIGDAFDGKHHTTVMHSISKIHELRQVDKDLDRTVINLLQKFRPPNTRSGDRPPFKT